MSARAAWRLESLGFSSVYRYVAGRLDWFVFGLPMVGNFAAIPKAMDVVRQTVPTCHLRDRVGEVHQRCQEAGWQVCLVVNETNIRRSRNNLEKPENRVRGSFGHLFTFREVLNIVLGRLRREAWKADPAAPVEQVMESGPTTFRPDNFLEPLVRRMQEKKVGSVIITNSDGVVIGILYRKDAEERLNQKQPAGERVY